MNAATNFLNYVKIRCYLKSLLKIKMLIYIFLVQTYTLSAQGVVLDSDQLDSVLEKVFPAVVNISITVSEHEITNLKIKNSSFPKLFKFCHEIVCGLGLIKDSGVERFQSVGSGIIVDKGNGYIITNYHVIQDSSEIFVTLFNEDVVKAKLVGSDSVTDIAVLKIDNNGLSEIKFADPTSVKIGKFVAAIGNPFQLEYTATFGIISGINRTNLGIEEYENFIQTDAAINKGNSGGALVDFNGRLIGMNTAVISKLGGSSFGLAIPVDTVETMYKKIVKYGKIKRGRIGLHLKDIVKSSSDIKKASYVVKGVLVNALDKGSSADMAGLKIGDIIVGMDDKPVSNLMHVKKELGLKCVSENIKVKFLRNNKEQCATLAVE